MSVTKGYINFSEFFKIAYDAVIEPYANNFKKFSENGDREEMIKVLISIPNIENIKIIESYKGKDDIKAAELCNKNREMIVKDGIVHEEINKSSILTETLFKASAINCNAYEIVENIYDKKTHIWEPRQIGGAIYPSVSLINHSCYPNVVRHTYPSGIVVVRTLRFVGKGTEILDCYGPHWFSENKLSRIEYLWKKYRFLCTCDACIQNWQYPLPEIMKYKCKTCSEIIGIIALNEKDMQNVLNKQCNCNKTINLKKIKNQLQNSIKKRLNAISKMHEGHYEQPLLQLLEHIQFIEKFFITPNMETIKTQQCIIQCYNQFACISQ